MLGAGEALGPVLGPVLGAVLGAEVVHVPSSTRHLYAVPPGSSGSSRHLKVSPVISPGQQFFPPGAGQPPGRPVRAGSQPELPAMHCSVGVTEGAELGAELAFGS